MTDWAAFFKLHSDLPREGPGDRESLDWALRLARVPKDASILDAGCGPGGDIPWLLRHAPKGHVTAIDAHAPFVEVAAAAHKGDARVTARVGDMAKPGGPYDLIWCAGAAYFLGITEALQTWRGALAPGGKVALSEAVWLTADPSPAARASWADYPAMTDVPGLEARVAAANYRLLGTRILPDAAWEAYYTPMEARIAALRPGADAALTAVLDEGAAEMAAWRAHRDQFGYALIVAEPQ